MGKSGKVEKIDLKRKHGDIGLNISFYSNKPPAFSLFHFFTFSPTEYRAVFFVIFCAVSFAANSFAQTKNPASKPPAETKQTPANLPKITQIDDAKIKELLKPQKKPLLVNFWATWCAPCREEFPDLVKIDTEYRGKIDFFTVSLDFIEEINRDVPKFLSEMKSEMPAFLLVSEDESTLISTIAKDWSGSLPFTILYNERGEIAYVTDGKVKPEVLRAEIEKVLVQPRKKAEETIVLMDFVKIKNGKRDEALFFYENNWKVYREIALKKGFIQSYELVEATPDPKNQFDLILITRYANEEQFKNNEKNFEPILKDTRPNGPMLKNDLKPEDFRQNVFINIGKPLFRSEN